MRMYDIIYKKKIGQALSKEEIDFFVSGVTDGTIPDYQISAFLMAVCFNSMNDEETVFLTDAMRRSGDTLDLLCFGNLSVDKHSTGGVGDKTTLIVAPIVASLGGKVAKMSGRGLGFTGGTVDKLESVRGYRSSLPLNEFLSQVEQIGIAVTGQSGDFAPADKKLYALRDVTATVDSIPLITSSIMSKKLASGSHSIVLDVKVGNGTFMKNRDDAKKLAESMIKIGNKFGRNVCALLTDMEMPLGKAVGNSIEVYEAVSVLSGEGDKRLKDLCLCVSAQMVSMSLGYPYDLAYEKCVDSIKSGKALNKMKEWISYQGGDVSFIEHKERLLEAKFKKEYKAKKSGYISLVKADDIGIASMTLGAGRKKKEDDIDFEAGIFFSKTYGDEVRESEAILTMYSSNENLFTEAEKILDGAILYSETKPPERPILIDKIIKKAE